LSAHRRRPCAVLAGESGDVPRGARHVPARRGRRQLRLLHLPETGRNRMLFEPTIAGSLPKPGWLAETEKLWPKWKLEGAALDEAKRDAALIWLKHQEDAGITTVTDGEQFRTHFVHGFLESV